MVESTQKTDVSCCICMESANVENVVQALDYVNNPQQARFYNMRIKCKTCVEAYCELCFIRILSNKNACANCRSLISDYFIETNKYMTKQIQLIQDGVYTTFYDCFKPSVIDMYCQNNAIVEEQFFEKSRLKSKHIYENGYKKLFIRFYENGTKEIEIYYENGEAILEIDYDKNGTKEIEIHYEGLYKKIQINYNENGTKRFEQHYEDGYKKLEIRYNENETERLELHFENGQMILEDRLLLIMHLQKYPSEQANLQ